VIKYSYDHFFIVSISNENTPSVSYVEVSADRVGQRIDNFLFTQLKGVPKSHVYRLLRKGQVRVNKGRIGAHYRLQLGDNIRIPPVRTANREAKSQASQHHLKLIEKAILYEDPGLIVINKPSGIAVHGGSGISHGVIEIFRELRPDAHYLELVHRLDRDTSGCLIIAKKRSLLRTLHELLRENKLEKRYLALIKGQWTGRKTTVKEPLRKNTLRSGERMVEIDPQGKPAESVFIPMQKFTCASLVEVKIKTGRTHQIRVHAASIGHPVAGDEKYGEQRFNRELRKQGLKRMFLHAKSVAFELPEPHQVIKVTAPLEPSLKQLLDNLS
jgi:23S rRNA pseudouridine955/2504/2580 synthase